MKQDMKKSLSTHGRRGAGGLPPTPPSTPLTPSVAALPSEDETSDALSQISEFPNRNNIGHRRVHSEIITFGEPDNFSSDIVTDAGVLGGGPPSLSGDSSEEEGEVSVSKYLNFDGSTSSAAHSSSAAAAAAVSSAEQQRQELSPPNISSSVTSSISPPTRVVLHCQPISLDGTSFIKPDELLPQAALPGSRSKRTMSPDELAQLALVDPKRAKRIITNRQSAARSRQRSLRRVTQLEQGVRNLQTEVANLSDMIAQIETDASAKGAENSQLRRRLEQLEQHTQLEEVQTNAIIADVRRLRLKCQSMGVPYDDLLVPSYDFIKNFTPSCETNRQCDPPGDPVHQLQTLHLQLQQQRTQLQVQVQVQVQVQPQPQQPEDEECNAASVSSLAETEDLMTEERKEESSSEEEEEEDEE